MLYGYWQTKRHVATPLRDGVVPLNDHGNFDLPHPCYLPTNAAHVDVPHACAVAAELGISYAPAMMGFVVRAGRLAPDVRGIVVPAEFRQVIADGARERGTSVADKRERARESKILRRWEQVVGRYVQYRSMLDK